jgi:beta-lactamase class A
MRSSTRRQLVLGAVGATASDCFSSPGAGAAPGRAPSVEPLSFAEIEARAGGRLGVFALDTGSGRQLAHRPDERFAMCSTFKWVLAAAVLARVDAGQLTLDERVVYGPADLLEYAPVTRAHIAERSMTCRD